MILRYRAFHLIEDDHMFSYLLHISMNVAFGRDVIDIWPGILPIGKLDCRLDFPRTLQTVARKAALERSHSIRPPEG